MERKYAVLFALLLAVPMISAVSSNPVKDAVKGDLLGSALDEIKCRNDFTVGVIDSITSADSNASALSSYASALQKDYTQLQVYVSANDSEGFRTFVKATYKEDVKSTDDAIRNWRKTGRKAEGKANETRETLRAEYEQLRPVYQECRLGAVKEHANARVRMYNGILDHEDQRIQNLSARGIDTQGLRGVVDEARNRIVSPLQNGINSATDAKEIISAMHSYCLYNGCQNGTNDHFAAKVNIERLGGVLGKIKSSNQSGNFGPQIADAEENLAMANSAVAGFGMNHYDQEQHDAVWDPIKEAAGQIKEILALIKGNNV
ncbi:hypothetical protein HY988_04220 [Candidatus Micrarchaeota archaeon]|nr:hypothetical protein [Candidatus Micrarchaeota archaeon]